MFLVLYLVVEALHDEEIVVWGARHRREGVHGRIRNILDLRWRGNEGKISEQLGERAAKDAC